MKTKAMKYITILDFGTGLVHQLTIDSWNIDEETCEEYMERIGFNSEDCHWMVHEKGGIQFNV